MHVFVFIIKLFRNSYFLDALFKLWRQKGLRGLYKVSLPCSMYVVLLDINDVLVTTFTQPRRLRQQEGLTFGKGFMAEKAQFLEHFVAATARLRRKKCLISRFVRAVNERWRIFFFCFLSLIHAVVVAKVSDVFEASDSAIHQINHYPVNDFEEN